MLDDDDVGDASDDQEISGQRAARAKMGLDMGCTATGSKSMVAGTLVLIRWPAKESFRVWLMSMFWGSPDDLRGQKFLLVAERLKKLNG